MVERIRELCAAPGVSGAEEAVRYAILKHIEGHCIYKVDALGNILAFKKGKAQPKHKLMLSAHMDEVGLIITHIEIDGLLRFAPVGGIDARTMAARSVHIGAITGVVGVKPVHLRTSEEKDKAAKVDELFIDIGAESREEAEKVVSPGDRAVFHAPFVTFGSGFLRGRALDDRIGCAMMIELIQSELPYDVHFAFTVQEETGTTGAKTAAVQIAPEIAIAVETTTACDIPGSAEDKVVCRLGAGAVLSFMDRGTIYDRTLYSNAFSAAQKHGIACQCKEGVFGGNESRSVQTAGNGARVLAVSVPCRYLHTPCCVAKLSDIEATARLLSVLIEEFGA